MCPFSLIFVLIRDHFRRKMYVLFFTIHLNILKLFTQYLYFVLYLQVPIWFILNMKHCNIQFFLFALYKLIFACYNFPFLSNNISFFIIVLIVCIA